MPSAVVVDKRRLSTRSRVPFRPTWAPSRSASPLSTVNFVKKLWSNQIPSWPWITEERSVSVHPQKVNLSFKSNSINIYFYNYFHIFNINSCKNYWILELFFYSSWRSAARSVRIDHGLHHRPDHYGTARSGGCGSGCLLLVDGLPTSTQGGRTSASSGRISQPAVHHTGTVGGTVARLHKLDIFHPFEKRFIFFFNFSHVFL